MQWAYLNIEAEKDANESKADGKIPRKSTPSALAQIAIPVPLERGASSALAAPGSRI